MMCPECGGDTKSTIEGSTLVISCEKCDWSIATTYVDPIFEDETTYKLRMGPEAPCTKEALKSVSLLMGRNFIDAKKALSTPGRTLLECKAPEMKEAVERLFSAGVPYDVVPEFPYSPAAG